MFGHQAGPSRVYAYGAKPPEDRERAGEQIDRAWRYRNDLVAVELERRRCVDETVGEYFPGLLAVEAQLAEAQAELEAIRAQIRGGNANERRKEPTRRGSAPREARERIKSLRSERKRLRTEAFADAGLRAALDGIDTRDLAERKRLRAACGLGWGTYLSVEQSLSGIRSGAPPRFVRRAEWGGKLAVQIQSGATWDELIAGHGQAQLERVTPEGGTGRRSHRPYYRLWLRVGSEGPGNRIPVWVRARFVLHRPLPDGGRVKWIYLVRRRVATHEEWSVQFVIERAAGFARADTTEAGGDAAIDMGWRRLDDGSLRVAYAVAEGWHEELVIPAAILARETKAADLQEIRDRNFALTVAALGQWLASAELPDWLREQTATLPQWRSQARLAALVLRWGATRFDGDEPAYAPLDAWRKQDEHLYLWQAHNRRRLQRWRLDHYRRFAARLRWRFERAILEDTDWRALLRRPEAEHDDETQNTRRMARIASPGLLRQVIEASVNTVRVDALNSTRTCSVCGSDPADDWDAARELTYRCVMGHHTDQDRNAALNLLARASGEVVGE